MGVQYTSDPDTNYQPELWFELRPMPLTHSGPECTVLCHQDITGLSVNAINFLSSLVISVRYEVVLLFEINSGMINLTQSQHVNFDPYMQFCCQFSANSWWAFWMEYAYYSDFGFFHRHISFVTQTWFSYVMHCSWWICLSRMKIS